MNVTLKRVIVVIPFLAMLIDILSWFPARIFPEFAYVVVGTGDFMGLPMGIQNLISLYQLWIFWSTILEAYIDGVQSRH